MTDHHPTTPIHALVRRYADAWSPMSPTRRRDALASVWVDDGQYLDPTSAVRGRDAFADHIEGFQATYPGATFAVDGVIEHHGLVYFHWTLMMPNVGGVLEGRTFAELAPAGDRFQRNVGFFVPPAAP